MRRMNSQGEGLGELNLAIKRHLELQIKNLQNVLRGPERLELLFKRKKQRQKEKEEAMDVKDTQGLGRRSECSR